MQKKNDSIWEKILTIFFNWFSSQQTEGVTRNSCSVFLDKKKVCSSWEETKNKNQTCSHQNRFNCFIQQPMHWRCHSKQLINKKIKNKDHRSCEKTKKKYQTCSHHNTFKMQCLPCFPPWTHNPTLNPTLQNVLLYLLPNFIKKYDLDNTAKANYNNINALIAKVFDNINAHIANQDAKIYKKIEKQVQPLSRTYEHPYSEDNFEIKL